MSFATGRVMQWTYVNWRGQKRVRRVLPHHLWFGSTEYHPEKQWLIQCTDLQDGKQKDFAVSGIVGAATDLDQSLPWRS